MSNEGEELAQVLESVKQKYLNGNRNELARRIGVSAWTLTNVESAMNEEGRQHDIQPSTLRKIHSYLITLDDHRGLSLEEVFAWAGYIDPVRDMDSQFHELATIFQRLSKHNQHDVLQFARMKAREQATLD